MASTASAKRRCVRDRPRARRVASLTPPKSPQFPPRPPAENRPFASLTIDRTSPRPTPRPRSTFPDPTRRERACPRAASPPPASSRSTWATTRSRA
eukprot:31273-Pelagococcus_subviridis.AAC.7